MKIKLAGMVKESIADGPGIRLAVFTQGCNHNCPSCHNPETHDFAGGEWQETAEILAILQAAKLLRGITLSGGEPLDQLLPILELAKGAVAMGKDVIVYTGYTWEEIMAKSQCQPALAELLPLVWRIVDGPFVEAEKSLFLKFRGSANQRVIDVEKSLIQKEPISCEF